MCAACSTPRLNLSSELRPSWNNIQDTFPTGSTPDTILLQYESMGQKATLLCAHILEYLLSLLVRRIHICVPPFFFPHTPHNNRGINPIAGRAFLFHFDKRPCPKLSTIVLQMPLSQDHPRPQEPERDDSLSATNSHHIITVSVI